MLVVDPIAPADEAAEVWARLDADPPTAVVVLDPHHVRDVDAVVARYGARAFGPRLFFRDEIPAVDLEPIEAGSELPGGVLAVHDGRDRGETPIWIPSRGTLIFADDVRGTPEGLRLWDVPWFEERTLPAMRKLLDLPIRRVLTSHGEPVHDRADFEAAIDSPPSSNEEQAEDERRRSGTGGRRGD